MLQPYHLHLCCCLQPPYFPTLSTVLCHAIFHPSQAQLKPSHSELELGADESEAEGSASRAALYILLDSVKARFEQSSPDWGPKISFNYKPGKPKSEEWKRKHRELQAERKRHRSYM